MSLIASAMGKFRSSAYCQPLTMDIAIIINAVAMRCMSE